MKKGKGARVENEKKERRACVGPRPRSATAWATVMVFAQPKRHCKANSGGDNESTGTAGAAKGEDNGGQRDHGAQPLTH
jgi:hypothetical protein